MTKQEVIEMVKNPLLVNDINSEKLLALTKEYPYCHAFHLLHLKGLKNTNSIEFEKYLPLTSLNAPNREVLYDLIVKMKLREKIEQVEEEISQSVAQEIQTEILPTEEQKQAEKESVVNEVEAIILEELAHQQYSIEKQFTEEPQQEKQEEKTKQLPEEMSFLDWLNPSSVKQQKKVTKASIIDRFIKENPSISKPKPETYNTPDLAKLSIEDNDDLVTETLARVYMKQGHYDKAIKTYQKLSLKIPEKKAFFASQIEVIEELKKQK